MGDNAEMNFGRQSGQAEQKVRSIIRVRVNSITGNTIEGTHVMSNFKIKATFKSGMNIEKYQVVLVEYIATDKKNAGYIVIDDLSEEIEANVLEAQHIISDGVMYTSLICEHTVTRARIHSLVPNFSKLFLSTNIIVRGDKVLIKLNNGEIFNITRKEQ